MKPKVQSLWAKPTPMLSLRIDTTPTVDLDGIRFI
jgi:hypothetical protein